MKKKIRIDRTTTGKKLYIGCPLALIRFAKFECIVTFSVFILLGTIGLQRRKILNRNMREKDTALCWLKCSYFGLVISFSLESRLSKQVGFKNCHKNDLKSS